MFGLDIGCEKRNTRRMTVDRSRGPALPVAHAYPRTWYPRRIREGLASLARNRRWINGGSVFGESSRGRKSFFCTQGGVARAEMGNDVRPLESSASKASHRSGKPGKPQGTPM